MRFEPGFLPDLRGDLSSIDPVVVTRVERKGALSRSHLLRLASCPTDLGIDQFEWAGKGDVVADWINVEHERIGQKAINAGEVAFCVLAGGEGTRVGGPKALLKMPRLGLSLLAMKIQQASGCPTWVMTSPRIFVEVGLHVAALSPTPRACIFEQFEAYRMTVDNRISFTALGVPETCPSGHGDLGPSLVENGVLADNPEIKHVIVCNVDNVLALPEPTLLGRHIAQNQDVTCEVISRETPGGGHLVWANDRLQVVEDFRLGDDTKQSLFQNTNTMIMSRRALEATIDWRWYRRRKHVGGRIVVQHERLLQQYTEEFPTQYVLVNETRYLPIKEPNDLMRADFVLNGNSRW